MRENRMVFFETILVTGEVDYATFKALIFAKDIKTHLL